MAKFARASNIGPRTMPLRQIAEAERSAGVVDPEPRQPGASTPPARRGFARDLSEFRTGVAGRLIHGDR
jgi:hypothetical protein